jgi:AraC-like DNA-binding protein
VKPAFEHTPQRSWESFHCEVVHGSSYNATWHFHPEIQLTLVLQSTGYRLVGDNISPLRSGDVVLVGPNLPHVWHQEEPLSGKKAEVHAIIIRFLKTFLGNDALALPEMKKVVSLFDRSGRGLQVLGATRARVAALMQQLPQKQGLSKVAGLLTILAILADSKELKPLASAGFVPQVSRADQERLERIISYINEHLSEPIDRGAVAGLAHLNATAFSRFFKVRTGKTLPQYVNEVRIGRACRLLADERAKVVDIALECGFPNLANFNRRFLQITGMQPSEYRSRLFLTRPPRLQQGPLK